LPVHHTTLLFTQHQVYRKGMNVALTCTIFPKTSSRGLFFQLSAAFNKTLPTGHLAFAL
jgi:hypothetical protein